MVEVVIFHGPPYSGKSLYYEQHLKSTHDRISADELFREHREWGMRNVVLRILGCLQEGRGVVVDDENWCRKTRESYIRNIREKMPSCQFVCYTFKPVDAFECLRRRGWSLAKQFLEDENAESGTGPTGHPVDPMGSEARIHAWFKSETGDPVQGLDAVLETEGWQQVRDIRTSLIAESSYKFELPALFLEQSVLMDKYSDQLLRGLHLWKDTASCGRVIVLACLEGKENNAKDKASEDSSMVENYETLLKEVKDVTQRLSMELGIPIYFMIVTDQQKNIATKDPGFLSFLQRMHCLNFSHPGTVYVHQSTSKERPLLSQTGLKQFHVSAVCQNPILLDSQRSAQILSPSHPAISDITLVADHESSSPRVPLYKMAAQKDGGSCGSYVVDERWGLVIGVSFCDERTFDVYQQEYVASASHISAEAKEDLAPRSPLPVRDGSLNVADRQDHVSGQTPTKRPSNSTRRLPAWMTSKKERREENKEKLNADGIFSVSPSRSKKKESESSKENPHASLPWTVYAMTVAELREVAKLYSDKDDDVYPPTSPEEEHDTLSDVQSAHRKVDDKTVATANNSRPRIHTHTETEDVQGSGVDEASVEDGGKKERESKGVGGREEEEDGVASIITDLFSETDRCRKPPPKKKTPVPGSVPQGTMSKNKMSELTKPFVLQEDLSFLDEIF